MAPVPVSRSQFSAEFGDITVSDEAVDKAIRTVCSMAADAAEADEILRMLAIHPGTRNE